MNKLIVYISAAFIITCIAFVVTVKTLVNEKQRFESNQIALLSDVKHYRTSDSLNVASVEKLTLTNREFKEFNTGLTKTVESLNLKVRLLQSASMAQTETKYIIKTEVKDSLVFVNQKPDTIKCINYIDTWLSMVGCIQNKTFAGIIQSKDTIEQIVHRVPRKFLFFKYGTKAIRQEVLSKNPHTEVVYTEYIEFKH